MTDAIQLLLSSGQHPILDADSPTPLYHQLYSMLRDCIVGGILADGTKMPSEKELAAAFDVSRITARRALHDLAADNLVARHRGRGTFVTYSYHPEPVNAPLVGMLQSLEHMGRETRIKVLTLRHQRAPAEIADSFNIPHDRQLTYILRVRSHNNMPFAHYESWTLGLPKSVTRASLEKHPRLELLRKAGVTINRIEQSLSAVAATPAIASALGIMPGKPMLRLIRSSYDRSEQQVDYIDAVYNPERFQYRMNLTVS